MVVTVSPGRQVGIRAGGSVFGQHPADHLFERGEFFLDYPDEGVVDGGVPVDEDVPEGGYSRELGDPGGEVRCGLGELVESLSDDLELAFGGSAKRRVRLIVGEGLAVGEAAGSRRIATGLKRKRLREPLSIVSGVDAVARETCWGFGATVAASLMPA